MLKPVLFEICKSLKISCILLFFVAFWSTAVITGAAERPCG